MTRKSLERDLLAVAIYAMAAILLTWPLVSRLGSCAYPTVSNWYGGDPNLYIWWFDWLNKFLFSGLPHAAGEMLFWPIGIDPAAGYDGLLMLVLGVPLTGFTGNPVLAYDIFLLACFVSSAWVSYRFVFRLTDSFTASIVAGLIFGFSPYMMVRGLQHPNLMMTFVVPLLAWATWDFLEAPTIKRACLVAGAVFLSALSSWYYLVGGLVFLLLAFLSRIKAVWGNRLLAALAVFLIASAAALPALPMLVSDSGGGKPAMRWFVDAYGARPLNFVLPHPYTNVFGRATQQAYADFIRRPDGLGGEWESTSYFGPLLLAIILFFGIYRKNWGSRRPWFWLISVVVFSVLAMGNYVDLAGKRLPLPFLLLHEMFPFSLIRVSSRFFIFALLAATVIAGLVLAWLFRRLPRRWSVLLAIPIIALLLSERIILPYPVSERTMPDFYRQIADEKDEPFAVADLPIFYTGDSLYNYYQITHGHPLVGGEYFYPSYSSATFNFVRSNPLLLASFCEARQEPISLTDKRGILDDLDGNRVRYVVVHNLILHNDAACAGATARIRDFFSNLAPYFSDGEITVYRVPDLVDWLTRQ